MSRLNERLKWLCEAAMNTDLALWLPLIATKYQEFGFWAFPDGITVSFEFIEAVQADPAYYLGVLEEDMQQPADPRFVTGTGVEPQSGIITPAAT